MGKHYEKNCFQQFLIKKPLNIIIATLKHKREPFSDKNKRNKILNLKILFKDNFLKFTINIKRKISFS